MPSETERKSNLAELESSTATLKALKALELRNQFQDLNLQEEMKAASEIARAFVRVAVSKEPLFVPKTAIVPTAFKQLDEHAAERNCAAAAA
jgi:hypothetical protein